MTRIALVFPGGSVTMFAYKRKPTPKMVSDKLVELATTLFRTWDWMPVPGIQPHEGGCMLIPIEGGYGQEVGL